MPSDVTRLCCIEPSRDARDRVAVPFRVQMNWASSVNAASMWRCASVDAEFVMPAANVLHQRMTTDDHRGSVVTFEPAHRTESGFESAVVTFDAVVRVLL